MAPDVHFRSSRELMLNTSTAAYLLVGPDQHLIHTQVAKGLARRAQWCGQGRPSQWPCSIRGIPPSHWRSPYPVKTSRGGVSPSGIPDSDSSPPGSLVSPRALGPHSSPTKNSGTGSRRRCTVGSLGPSHTLLPPHPCPLGSISVVRGGWTSPSTTT